MKSNGKKAAKATASRNGNLKAVGRKGTKTASAKRSTKMTASKNGKKREVAKSTVPPRFRELKQLAAKNDPRFWELRLEFRDFVRNMPEDEMEPFMEGLGQPYLDYLVTALIQQSWKEDPVMTWGN
jgi:hypothetical protein